MRSIFSSTKLSIFALVLFVLAQSCKKSSDLQAPAAATTETAAAANNIEALRQSVASSVGLPVNKVVYSAATKNFVVDGDGLVSLEDAQARFATSGTASAANGVAQRSYVYLVSSANYNVKIYTDATVSADWVAVIDQAIANWNSAGSAITLSRVSSATTNTISFTTTYDNATNVIATTSYPSYLGTAGRTSTINTYYTYLSVAQKVFAITHEIGHALGFTHTNGTYGNLIAGTTDNDANSIMNAVCLSWSAFTDYDLTAFRTIYPASSSSTSTAPTTTTTTTTDPTTSTTTTTTTTTSTGNGNGKGKNR